jgi:hypothetical protein
MITNLNRNDCCTTRENLVEIMKKTHIHGAGLYQCRKCLHSDFYPQTLFQEEEGELRPEFIREMKRIEQDKQEPVLWKE